VLVAEKDVQAAQRRIQTVEHEAHCTLEETRASLVVFQVAKERAGQAKSELIEANLRLVADREEAHQPWSAVPGPDPEAHRPDEAVDKFEHRAATAQPTRPGGSARRSRADRDQARTIRIPVHMIETMNKSARPALPCRSSVAADARGDRGRDEMPPRRCRWCSIAKEPISLETPIGEDEDSHLGDFLEDKKRLSITDEVIQRNLAAHTRKVLSTLTPREEKVLKMRFGIGERSNHTLEEVGQDFAVTRERIRQIEARRCASCGIEPRVLRAFVD
jgi:RNA polymerase primary sigma factor